MSELKNRSIVLVSGGMDSCVTAAVAARESDPALLHVGYGQRTRARELRAFHDIADFYGVKTRLVTAMPHLGEIGGSSLTDTGREVEKAGSTPPGEIPSTYVPFRNAQLLAIAVSWAEVLGATGVYIGAVEEDSSGYPDCRRVFYEAFNEVVRLGTRPGTFIEIVTPIIGMRKEEIVRLGHELGAPLHLSWSCYRREDVACGECESCVLRLKGFEGAGLGDPLPYRS